MEIFYFCLGGGSLLCGAAHLRAGIDHEQILVSRLTARVGQIVEKFELLSSLKTQLPASPVELYRDCTESA